MLYLAQLSNYFGSISTLHSISNKKTIIVEADSDADAFNKATDLALKYSNLHHVQGTDHDDSGWVTYQIINLVAITVDHTIIHHCPHLYPAIEEGLLVYEQHDV